MGADPGAARRSPWGKRFAALAGLVLALVVAANVYLIAASGDRLAAGFDKTPPRPYALVYAASGGLIVTMAATAIMEYASAPNTMHSALFYEVTGAVLPVFLVAFGRAGRLRWPATTTAAIYMVLSLVMMWTLEAFPATPKLAPIYNPVTHMVPPFFPLILIVPAVAIDLLLRRFKNDWVLSVVIGVTFDPIEVSPAQLINGSRTIQGWAAGTPADSEDTLRFAELTGVRPMIETYPLERAAEAYARMMSGNAQFRVVLTM